jgi:hypothetical protein
MIVWIFMVQVILVWYESFDCLDVAEESEGYDSDNGI